MKRTDIIALLIVLSVVSIGGIGLIAHSFSSSNLAGQAMYVKGYQRGYQQTPMSVPGQLQSSRASISDVCCECPKEEGIYAETAEVAYTAPVIQSSCMEDDESLAGSSAVRHNNPGVQETLTVRQGSTILQTKQDSCFGDGLIQWECNPSDPRNPRELRQTCEVECRSGRCAQHPKPAGSCREFDHGVSGFIGGSGFGRTMGYLTDSCANRKVLVDVYCDRSIPINAPIRERYIVCDGECRSSPVRLPNGESRTYGICV